MLDQFLHYTIHNWVFWLIVGIIVIQLLFMAFELSGEAIFFGWITIICILGIDPSNHQGGGVMAFCMALAFGALFLMAAHDS